MKKIVALVLSLVMVLGLATTAFAAADQYELYKADNSMNTALALGTPSFNAKYTIDEVAAKTNADGSGNVAYLVVTNVKTNAVSYLVKTTTPTIDSYAVTAAGKTTALFYVDKPEVQDVAVFSYKASVKEFTNFGLKCGQYYAIPDADDVYFQTAAGLVYLADDASTTADNYLLDGKVVSADVSVQGKLPIDHSFSATNFKYDAVKKVNVPTEATCTTCLQSTTSIYLDGKVPATYTRYALTNGGAYVVGLADPTVVTPAVDAGTTTEKVESAQTFDAGIAMYVGMSVMAAAGSAVVLKKKD